MNPVVFCRYTFLDFHHRNAHNKHPKTDKEETTDNRTGRWKTLSICILYVIEGVERSISYRASIKYSHASSPCNEVRFKSGP